MRALRIATTAAPLLLALACLEPSPARPPHRPLGGGGSGPEGGGPGAGGGAGGFSGWGVAGSGPGSCNDGPAAADLNGECLDAGATSPGTEISARMPVRNLSNRELALCPRALDAAFQPDPRLTLAPLASGWLTVRFTPKEEGSFTSAVVLAPCEPCTGSGPSTACLQGLSARASFVVEPSPIVFGPQPQGRQVCKEIRVYNTGVVPLRIQHVFPDDGLRRFAGTFELKVGGLTQREIPPGESASFQLCFRPASTGVEYTGNLFVYTDSERRKVPVSGGGTSCFAAEPQALDLGVTIPGVSLGGSVTLRDVCGHARLVDVHVEPPLFEVRHDALPTRLDADGLPVAVVLAAPAEEGTLLARLVAAVDTVDGPQVVFSVPVQARVAR